MPILDIHNSTDVMCWILFSDTF